MRAMVGVSGTSDYADTVSASGNSGLAKDLAFELYRSFV